MTPTSTASTGWSLPFLPRHHTAIPATPGHAHRVQPWRRLLDDRQLDATQHTFVRRLVEYCHWHHDPRCPRACEYRRAIYLRLAHALLTQMPPNMTKVAPCAVARACAREHCSNGRADIHILGTAFTRAPRVDYRSLMHVPFEERVGRLLCHSLEPATEVTALRPSCLPTSLLAPPLP